MKHDIHSLLGRRVMWLGIAIGLMTSAIIPATHAATLDDDPSGPRLFLTAPRDGEIFGAPALLRVETFGLGRAGGITDVELLVDGRSAAESHITFIRPPNPDEPVQHVFDGVELAEGPHTLLVRDLSDPKVASNEVTVHVGDKPPSDPLPKLRILAPAPGAILPPNEPLNVEAMGIGRFGGITQVELLVDGVPVAESQIVFIRAPEADEPVYHQFEVNPPPPIGPHRLTVRETGNPELVSPAVPIHIVPPVQAISAPLLRLTALSDGTLLLVLSKEEELGHVRIETSGDLLTWQPVEAGWPALRIPVSRVDGDSAPVAKPFRFYRAIASDVTD